jgi:hypothetical protein
LGRRHDEENVYEDPVQTNSQTGYKLCTYTGHIGSDLRGQLSFETFVSESLRIAGFLFDNSPSGSQSSSLDGATEIVAIEKELEPIEADLKNAMRVAHDTLPLVVRILRNETPVEPNFDALTTAMTVLLQFHITAEGHNNLINRFSPIAYAGLPDTKFPNAAAFAVVFVLVDILRELLSNADPR